MTQQNSVYAVVVRSNDESNGFVPIIVAVCDTFDTACSLSKDIIGSIVCEIPVRVFSIQALGVLNGEYDNRFREFVDNTLSIID